MLFSGLMKDTFCVCVFVCLLASTSPRLLSTKMAKWCNERTSAVSVADTANAQRRGRFLSIFVPSGHNAGAAQNAYVERKKSRRLAGGKAECCT